MDTNVNYTIVGIFVVALVTMAAVTILWLSSGFSYGEYKNYLVLMKESVSGLSIDSKVEYNGVSVGTVESIDLNRENPRVVEVLLNVKSNINITQGTIATLSTRGLTGLAYVALKDNSTDLRPLQVTGNAHYPVIPSSPSLFVRLDKLLSGLSKSFQDVSESLKSFLTKDNLATIESSLKNIDSITENLANNTKRFNNILRNTEITTQRVSSQTLPNTSRLLLNLDSVSQNINELTKEIKQNPSVLIRGSTTPTLGPGETP